MKIPTKEQLMQLLIDKAKYTRDIATSGMADNIWKNPVLVRGAEIIRETLAKKDVVNSDITPEKK